MLSELVEPLDAKAVELEESERERAAREEAKRPEIEKLRDEARGRTLAGAKHLIELSPHLVFDKHPVRAQSWRSKAAPAAATVAIPEAVEERPPRGVELL